MEGYSLACPKGRKPASHANHSPLLQPWSGRWRISASADASASSGDIPVMSKADAFWTTNFESGLSAKPACHSAGRNLGMTCGDGRYQRELFGGGDAWESCRNTRRGISKADIHRTIANLDRWQCLVMNFYTCSRRKHHGRSRSAQTKFLLYLQSGDGERSSSVEFWNISRDGRVSLYVCSGRREAFTSGKTPAVNRNNTDMVAPAAALVNVTSVEQFVCGER